MRVWALLMVIVGISCNTTRNQGAAANLGMDMLSGNWKLTEIVKRTDLSTLFPKKIPELNFNATDLRVSGNNGCNNISGAFTLAEDGKLQFGPMMATKMFCPGEGEGMFMEAIGKITSARLNEGVLEFTDGTDVLMKFIR